MALTRAFAIRATLLLVLAAAATYTFQGLEYNTAETTMTGNTNTKTDAQSNCLATWNITGATAFSGELSVSDRAAIGVVSAVPVSMPENNLSPIEATADFVIDGQVLLHLNPEKTKAFVDSRYFSDLTIGDATRGGQPITLGTASRKTLAAWEPRQIVSFLLAAELIQSYWHLESNLCLTEESTEGDLYTATIDGVHSYCTNECIDQPFRFSVNINITSGEMTLDPK